MSSINFVKMHGLGNDFVIINNIGSSSISLESGDIKAICNRHTGVGCDQLIVLESADDADCKMLIYNQDGGKAGACGNATRCVAKLINSTYIRVGDRRLSTTIHENGEVSVDMCRYSEALPISPLGCDGYFIDIGNPHFVYFNSTDIKVIGPKLERHPSFEEGANINCAHITGYNSINLIVWERGVGETLACGSGACATAIIAHKFMGLAPTIDITLKGGTLNILVRDNSVVMRGPATEVFTGSWTEFPYYT